MHGAFNMDSVIKRNGGIVEYAVVWAGRGSLTARDDDHKYGQWGVSSAYHEGTHQPVRTLSGNGDARKKRRDYTVTVGTCIDCKREYKGEGSNHGTRRCPDCIAEVRVNRAELYARIRKLHRFGWSRPQIQKSLGVGGTVVRRAIGVIK
jgi:hypothetical protein